MNLPCYPPPPCLTTFGLSGEVRLPRRPASPRSVSTPRLNPELTTSEFHYYYYCYFSPLSATVSIRNYHALYGQSRVNGVT